MDASDNKDYARDTLTNAIRSSFIRARQIRRNASNRLIGW